MPDKNQRITLAVMGIVVVGYLIYLILGQSPGTAFGGLGTSIGAVALILYLQDKVRERVIEPVIIQTVVRITGKHGDNPQEYRIEANVSNEGGLRAKDCEAVIQIDGNVVGNLSHVPVDSPIGRIGVNWPSEVRFSLYPRRPIWVTGSVRARPGTIASIVLRANGQENKSPPFELPESPLKKNSPKTVSAS